MSGHVTMKHGTSLASDATVVEVLVAADPAIVQSASPPDEAAPSDEESDGLKAIDVYIKTQRVGFESDPIFPFTAQQRRNIRLQFPGEAEFYDRYDNRLKSVRRLHFFLLSILFLTILVQVTVVIAPVEIVTGTFSAEYQSSFLPALPYLRLTFAFLTVATAIVAAMILRAWTRKTEIDPFASDIDHHYNHIMHEISDCEKRIGNRQDIAREAEMSENWAKVMLWNVLRLRDADRYASIVSWKMFGAARNAFADFALASILLVASAIVFAHPPTNVTDFVLTATAGVPILAGRWSRGFLATAVKKRTHGLSIGKPFREFGECIRRIVLRARAGEGRRNF